MWAPDELSVIRGGQGTTTESRLARSKMRALVARSLAGTWRLTDTRAPDAKLGVSRRGLRGPVRGVSAAKSGKSKRTRSMSSRPSHNSKANRPIRRAVPRAVVRHTGAGSPTRIEPRSYSTE